MQRKVLVIENSDSALKLVSKLVTQAGLDPVGARTLTEARHKFANSTPEEYLCAVVGYQLPDAPHGEAIDFTITSFIPTIAVTDGVDNDTREAVLARDVVDYIAKENTQVYDYLSRLMARLDKNKHIAVLVVDHHRASRTSMAALLQRHNFQTYTAVDQEEALLQMATKPNIRLVITDEGTATHPATEFIDTLRKAFSKEELAIIGVSSGQSALNSARFLKSGANDVLRKPYCHEEFLCRIMQNIEMIENVMAIRRAADTDYLTGLPNRRHFFYSVGLGAKPIPPTPALALLDLDHFKRINDTYGHDAGDKVLKTVARLLERVFGDVLVARFGGEEFCVFMAEISPGHAVERMNNFIARLAQTPIKLGKQTINITVSVGLTTKTSHHIEDLLSKADKLLYRAKAQGRNQVVSDATN